MNSKERYNLNITYYVSIGAFAALYTLLSLPGAILSSITGLSIYSAIGNIFIIGIIFPLNTLIFRRFGAMTLWAIMVGILFIPLPIAGPPGLFIKVFYMAFWGVLADITFFTFKRFSDIVISLAVGIVQLSIGAYLATFIWNILGQNQLANEISQYSILISILIGLILGIIFSIISYYIYTKIHKTAILARIQHK